MDFMEIELAAVGAELPAAVSLTDDEQAALRGGVVDLDLWLVAAGRVLRALPPRSAACVAVRALCSAPSWAGKRDDLAMVVECREREMGEAIDRYAEGGSLDGRDLARRRDELESLRRILEELERRLEDLDTAEFVARELDGLVREAREVDHWAEIHEWELARACAAAPSDIERLRATEAPGERSWWCAAAIAGASAARPDRAFEPLPSGAATADGSSWTEVFARVLQRLGDSVTSLLGFALPTPAHSVAGSRESAIPPVQWLALDESWSALLKLPRSDEYRDESPLTLTVYPPPGRAATRVVLAGIVRELEGAKATFTYSELASAASRDEHGLGLIGIEVDGEWLASPLHRSR